MNKTLLSAALLAVASYHFKDKTMTTTNSGAAATFDEAKCRETCTICNGNGSEPAWPCAKKKGYERAAATQATSGEATCKEDGGQCGVGGYCADRHLAAAPAPAAPIVALQTPNGLETEHVPACRCGSTDLHLIFDGCGSVVIGKESTPRYYVICHGCEARGSVTPTAAEAAAAWRDMIGAPSAQAAGIKTWQERVGAQQGFMPNTNSEGWYWREAMDEIANLRAALAAAQAQPAPAAGHVSGQGGDAEAWNDALEHAAYYVADHCVDGDDHAAALRSMKRKAVSGQGGEDASDPLRLFMSAAYPVASEINPRGYNWCEAYLDAAYCAAIAAKESNT